MRRRFEWNPSKAAANERLHGVTFDDGVKAFNDPFACEVIDEREAYGEERVNLLGRCCETVLHVTYTERGDSIRLISVRRADRHERDDYYRENGA